MLTPIGDGPHMRVPGQRFWSFLRPPTLKRPARAVDRRSSRTSPSNWEEAPDQPIQTIGAHRQTAQSARATRSPDAAPARAHPSAASRRGACRRLEHAHGRPRRVGRLDHPLAEPDAADAPAALTGLGCRRARPGAVQAQRADAVDRVTAAIIGHALEVELLHWAEWLPVRPQLTPGSCAGRAVWRFGSVRLP